VLRQAQHEWDWGESVIYLDYQATTPLAPEAREAMLRWLDGPEGSGFGNPHSPHRLGRQADAAVEIARERVGALFLTGGRIIFTSGATEALNIALRGCEPALAGKPVAVSAIEHAAVLDTARALPGEVHILPVNGEGLLDPEVPLPEGVGLISLMQVNNEIGTIQPVAELYRRAKAQGALFVCDAVQAAGKIPVAEADMIAISAHKFHGPKGIGALWVRDGVELQPIVTGGGQEGGLRSGTLSPALCAGMGVAAQLALERMEEDAAHVAVLWDRARELFAGWELNGSATMRYKGNLNLRWPGLDVARLMADVRQVCFSAGSACASGSGRPSHVLKAIGLSPEEARGSIRLGFGRYTTLDELERAAGWLMDAASQQG
jgi:cysteine desulfurase